MIKYTKINYTYSSDPDTVIETLNNLPSLVACDFEVANSLTKKQLRNLKVLEKKSMITREQKQQLVATGLSHPKFTSIVHMSVAWTDKDAFVVVCDTEEIRNVILNWIITTDIEQLWHNAVYDLGQVHYYTGKFPNKYIDTQLLAKTLINHADPYKSDTSLKELMGFKYGDWSIFEDSNITLENMHEETIIEYAAKDACATMALYYDIMFDLYGEEYATKRCGFRSNS